MPVGIIHDRRGQIARVDLGDESAGGQGDDRRAECLDAVAEKDHDIDRLFAHGRREAARQMGQFEG